VVTAGKCNNPNIPKPAFDYVQEGYAPQWNKQLRDDLGNIKQLGASAVRIEYAFGLESNHDHNAFLDRADSIGLQVIPGFYTQLNCPDFDCFDSWRAAARGGFRKGYKKGDGWHPAVGLVVLLDEPDALHMGGVTPDNCGKEDQAKCRVRAALSALDGVLQAEKDVGMNLTHSSVNFTIAWSQNPRDSIDNVVKMGIGTYGFQDMIAGIANPAIANYTPKTSKQELAMAFETRWTHGMNTVNSWAYVQEKVQADYDQMFGPKPWILTAFKGTGLANEQLQKDLQTMDAEASSAGSFLGVTLYSFQNDYTKAVSERMGLFALGNTSLGQTGKACQEDVQTHEEVCSTWNVYCLENVSSATEKLRGPAVVAAWKGNRSFQGICRRRRRGTGQSRIVV